MMTWTEFRAQGMAKLQRVRERVRWNLVVRGVAVTIAVGGTLVVGEAVVRARLGPLESRLPSTLLTRAHAWEGGHDAGAVPIATVRGAPTEYRVVVPFEEFPDHVIDAVLAVEDQRFFAHGGLDLRRIGGAMVANVRAMGIAQGGSTITQQLAKNLFLDARRTPLRKLREAAMALALEARHDKEAILAAYLNEIYLGQDGGRAIHGYGAAAQYYFNKPVGRLVLSEAATLAGMIHSPNRLVPVRHPEDAKARRDLVLDLMVEQGHVTRANADRSQRVAVPSRVHPSRALDGRFFRDAVEAEMRGRIAARGMVVQTTLDATLQRAAERAVATELGRLGVAGAEAALVAIDPRTGDIVAMVGGRDYGRSQFNRATDAKRQPGSAFKPFVAVAALARRDEEMPAFTLASDVEDAPYRVQSSSGTWEPVNYDGNFRGTVTLREAMEQSLNVPFARIGIEVGPERVAATAQRMGITSALRPVPSLALGSSEVTLLELVRAYGVLAAGGRLVPSRAVLGEAHHGDTLPQAAERRGEQVIDPAVAYLVTSSLQGAVREGTGRSLSARSGSRGLAGKTGTSNDWRDAWFVAYAPTLVVGVWVGHDDGRPLHRTGATAALPIVARFLADGAPRLGREGFPRPDGIVEAATTEGTGWFRSCGRTELFLEGTEPDSRGCVDFQRTDWTGEHDFDIDLDLDDLRDMFDREELEALTQSRDFRRFESELRREAGSWIRRLEAQLRARRQ